MPQHNSARIIGYRSNGCPVREIRGGSEPAAEPQGQDGGDIGDLLGGEPEPAGDDDSDDPEPQGEQPPAWWGTAQQQIQAKIDATVDRRINQLVNNRRQNHQALPTAGNAAQAVAVDANDLRYARSVARDTLNDSGVRLSPAEREFVNTATPGAIRAAMEQNSDPDSVGDQVGRAMADAIVKLRREHQTAIVAQLERRGALDRSKLKPGQPTPTVQAPTGGKASPDAQWAAGAEKAAELQARRGRRVPEQKTN